MRMVNPHSSTGLLAVALLCSAVRADEQPALPDYRRLDLVLTAEQPAALTSAAFLQLPLRVHIGYEPGKTPRQFWFSRERAAEQQEGYCPHLMPLVVQKRHLDTSKLRCGADRVEGCIAFVTGDDAKGSTGAYWVEGTLQLELTRSGNSMRGIFTRTTTVNRKKVEETGKAIGTVRTAAELTKAHAIAPGKDITSFPGNFGGKGFPPYDGEVVRKANDARLTWVSEDNCATAWRNTLRNFGGGYAPPILWHNRIYLYYHQPKPKPKPAEDALDLDLSFEEEEEDVKLPAVKAMKRGPEPSALAAAETAAAWSVSAAQEVAVCLDAATGVTLWKRVMDFEGAHNFGHAGAKAGPYQPPCTWDGRLFLQGTAGQLYCLDAMTGETVWEDKTKKTGGYPMFGLEVVDGVLLVGWGIRGARGIGPAGVDPNTGKHLWGTRQRAPREGDVDVAKGVATWVRDGKPCFVTGSGVFDPHTGEAFWRFPDSELNHFPAVHGDIALLRTKRPDSGALTLRAYRMSKDGCKELWAHPDGAVMFRWCHTCVSGGRVFGHLDNTVGGSSSEYAHRRFCTDLETGETHYMPRQKGWPGYCMGTANGLIIGNAGICRITSEPPFMASFGTFGYDSGTCAMAIYSDGRWFKRTKLGYFVCIDMRKKQ